MFGTGTYLTSFHYKLVGACPYYTYFNAFAEIRMPTKLLEFQRFRYINYIKSRRYYADKRDKKK